MMDNLAVRRLWLAAAVFLAVAVMAGAVYYYWLKAERPLAETAAENDLAQVGEPLLIGGQKDEGGCLTGAGYSWCQDRKECIRVWETYCTSAQPKPAIFKCADGKIITAVFYPDDDKFVDLDLGDDRKISLPRAISASGARYGREDESLVFWNKGDTAFITENGETTFKDCLVKD